MENTANHDSAFSRPIEEYTEIEFFIGYIHSQTILDAGGSSIRRDHYLVTAIYFTISVYITVFYVSRFNSTTKILCRAIIDFFLTAE